MRMHSEEEGKILEEIGAEKISDSGLKISADDKNMQKYPACKYLICCIVDLHRGQGKSSLLRYRD